MREFLGPHGIKRMKITMDLLRRTIIFRGMGQGAGDGLGIYGADGMAKKSQKYMEILKFYYPGTEVKMRAEI
jgi:stage II sporulation protein D